MHEVGQLLTWKDEDVEIELIDQYPDILEQDIESLAQEVKSRIRGDEYINSAIGNAIHDYVSEEIEKLKKEMEDGQIHED